MARHTIYVTEDHIRRGTKCSPFSCPIALALKEQGPKFGATDGGRVGRYHVMLVNPDGTLDLPQDMSRSGCRFIVNFDDGKPVKPFTFALNFPK